MQFLLFCVVEKIMRKESRLSRAFLWLHHWNFSTRGLNLYPYSADSIEWDYFFFTIKEKKGGGGIYNEYSEVEYDYCRWWIVNGDGRSANMRSKLLRTISRTAGIFLLINVILFISIRGFHSSTNENEPVCCKFMLWRYCYFIGGISLEGTKW